MNSNMNIEQSVCWIIVCWPWIVEWSMSCHTNFEWHWCLGRLFAIHTSISSDQYGQWTKIWSPDSFQPSAFVMFSRESIPLECSFCCDVWTMCDYPIWCSCTLSPANALISKKEIIQNYLAQNWWIWWKMANQFIWHLRCHIFEYCQ